MTDPEDDTNHVYRYRATKIQGAQAISIHCDLYQGTTLIRADSAHTLTTGVWETFTVSLTTGQASGITDYGDIRLRCIPETGGGGGQPAVAAVTWTEFEIPDASGNPPISVSDTWTFVESTEQVSGFTRSGTDTWSFVESTDVAGMFVRSGTDTWTFVESTQVEQQQSREGSDVWVFVESTDVQQEQTRSGTDTWIFVESSDVSGMFTRSGTDVWSFVESTDVIEGGGGYTPGGKYIWFICALPGNDTRGCVFAFDCGAGNYVRGINENGTLICEALPP